MASKKKNVFIPETFGDYLKTIYTLSLDKTPVSTSAIAKQLQTSNASASDTIRRLSKKKYVNHVPYKGVTLTAKGEQEALTLLRRHRLWEVFLIDVLGVPLPEVHQYAELLEHVTDDTLSDYLAIFLKYPEKDPHGNPIPTKDGKVITKFPRLRLTELKEKQPAELIQFSDEDPELIKYLDGLGLKLGAQITIQKRIAYDKSLQIHTHTNNSNINIGKEIAGTLMVRII